MLPSISSLSFTLSSKEQTSALITQCQYLLEELYQNIIDSSATLKLTSLSSTFQTLKENVSKQRNQLLQLHLKSLQHLEILLFQKDYKLALQKIDEYKKYPLIERFNFTEEISEPSFSPAISQFIQEAQYPQYSFEEAIKIVESEETTLEEKERAWLSVVMKDQEQDEYLLHVTEEDIQKAQIEIFKKEFNIHSSSQCLLKNFPETPEKRGAKSSISLKKKKKSKSILSSNKYTQKQKIKDVKGNSSQKKIMEKKTVRKKAQKDSEQSKTAKKHHELHPFLF